MCNPIEFSESFFSIWEKIKTLTVLLVFDDGVDKNGLLTALRKQCGSIFTLRRKV